MMKVRAIISCNKFRKLQFTFVTLEVTRTTNNKLEKIIKQSIN